MISRFPGLTPTRSRAVVHDGLVFTVAVAPDPVTSSMYEQSAKALARIDAVGSDFEMKTGFCGKAGQTAPVGTGQGHVRIKGITVGGTAV